MSQPSDENRELIFRRFWRRDNRTGGAGLGLSIVKRIVDAHGGTIAVRNRPNGGAEFCMRFPLSGERTDASSSPVGNLRTMSTEKRVASR